MKIVYILKKGLQCYPPCMAQVLLLADLNADITIYHGNNTNYINQILDARGIEHRNLNCDADSKNRFESAFNFFRYGKTINKLIKKLPLNVVVWFGNCESAIAVKKKNLANRRYVLSVLELYERDTIYDKGLKKIINSAEAVIACEKHRAAIMRAYYPNANCPIYVMPNKPYDDGNQSVPDISSLENKLIEVIYNIKSSKVILYQGIVARDRPLDKIAEALNKLNNTDNVFVVMGKASEEIQKELKAIYKNTVFTGYIPSPQHLCITQFACIGIANYDYSCLNNLFCAPNKIYEYAKFGLPMLTSQNIGLTETVGICGAAECVDFSSVDDIANGLNKILNNVDAYSENARRFYEQVDNKSVIKELLAQMQSSSIGEMPL